MAGGGHRAYGLLGDGVGGTGEPEFAIPTETLDGLPARPSLLR